MFERAVRLSDSESVPERTSHLTISGSNRAAGGAGYKKAPLGAPRLDMSTQTNGFHP
jgi:hypothetical protein